MRYGLELPVGGVFADVSFLAELATLAEQNGWDGVFLEDYIVHHIEPDAPTCDPWVALAAIALATEHIRIGTTVTALSRRRPWKVARETVSLDHLSRGRLILGVGLGDANDPAFSRFSEETEPRVRARRLDESLDVIAGLWSGEPFSYHGEHFQVDEVTFWPTPVQVPRIPIWVGGNWPNAGPIRRAARWDGFVGGKVKGADGQWCPSAEEARQLKRDIAERRTGAEPFEIALGGAARGQITGDLDRDREWIAELAEAGATWWMEYVWHGDADEIRQAVARGPLRVA
jgi:alkanesulfonate monooxygenase SsuD/methylene tetrahydromethanopterin reductase-like flavin-dependent oxidoreductase (luciferase family)